MSEMFTAEELKKRLTQNDGVVPEYLEISNFEAYAINEKTAKAVINPEIYKFGGQRVDLDPSCEQVFRVQRGLKKHFGNMLEFWVASVNALNWEFYYKIKDGTYSWDARRLLTEAEFYTWLDFRHHVPKMNPIYVEWLLAVRLRGAFQQAFLVDENWNNLVILAESEQEYLAFFWSFFENTRFNV